MRVRMFLAAWVGFVSFALGGDYESVKLSTASVIGTNTLVVTNLVARTGRIKSVSAVSVGGAATVTVSTVANRGSSLGAAKTIFGPFITLSGGVVTNFGTVSNFASDIYIAEDYLVLRADNSAITSAVTPSVVIIYEE